MELPIRHVHERSFLATLPSVVHAIDALWSGSPEDALPGEVLRPFRHSPAGSRGFAVGTRFGHGPFRFEVEHWDGQLLRARIHAAGFRGQHGFALRVQGDRVSVTHELDAHATLPHWLVWKLLVGAGHDWAVET